MSAKVWPMSGSNAISSQLDGTITDSDTSLTLSNASSFPSAGVLVVDRINEAETATPTQREYISYTGKSTNTLTGLSRGLGGSTAQQHLSGATVEEVFTVTHWGDLYDAILAEHNDNGTHSDVTADTVTIATGLDMADSSAVRDSSDNEYIKFSKSGSAVNEVTVGNAATGSAPSLSATGGDTNIDLKLIPKGTGALTVSGTTDYEDNVTDDDDIPNKAYVDTVAASSSTTAKFIGYAGSSLAITAGVNTKVQINTEVLDPGSNFDNATNYRFTAPEDGWYLVIGHVRFTSTTSGDALEAQIHKNGSLYALTGQTAYTTNSSRVEVSALVQLNSTQYVELFAKNSTHNDSLGGGSTYDTYLHIHKLS